MIDEVQFNLLNSSKIKTTITEGQTNIEGNEYDHQLQNVTMVSDDDQLIKNTITDYVEKATHIDENKNQFEAQTFSNEEDDYEVENAFQLKISTESQSSYDMPVSMDSSSNSEHFERKSDLKISEDKNTKSKHQHKDIRIGFEDRKGEENNSKLMITSKYIENVDHDFKSDAKYILKENQLNDVEEDGGQRQVDTTGDGNQNIMSNITYLPVKKKGRKSPILYPVCKICGYKRSYKDYVIDHIKVKHMNIKVEQICAKCDYTTNQKDNLRHHKRSHEATNYCDFCDHSASNTANLRKHIISMHEEKKHS